MPTAQENSEKMMKSIGKVVEERFREQEKQDRIRMIKYWLTGLLSGTVASTAAYLAIKYV